MKPRLSPKRNTAMTLFEVGIIVAVAMILVVVFFPRMGKLRRNNTTISCVNNLKQAGLAYRVWAGDNGDILPMGISVTNGGAMETIQTGDAVAPFLVMSNELSTPRILHCPADPSHSQALSFTSPVGSRNVSYFVGVDVTNSSANPLLILSGDSDLELGGVPAKSSLHSFWTNDPVAWSATRHIRKGNIGLADGSVQTVNSSQLHTYFVATGLATNRLAIP